jgi:hypothetical protein
MSDAKEDDGTVDNAMQGLSTMIAFISRSPIQGHPACSPPLFVLDCYTCPSTAVWFTLGCSLTSR